VNQQTDASPSKNPLEEFRWDAEGIEKRWGFEPGRGPQSRSERAILYLWKALAASQERVKTLARLAACLGMTLRGEKTSDPNEEWRALSNDLARLIEEQEAALAAPEPPDGATSSRPGASVLGYSAGDVVELVSASDARKTVVAWKAEVAKLRLALEQISKGEGRFSRDPLTHASNTIEDMKAIATKALSRPVPTGNEVQTESAEASTQTLGNSKEPGKEKA
jgi:hypothetical protein